MGKSKLSIKYSIQILNVKFVAKNYKKVAYLMKLLPCAIVVVVDFVFVAFAVVVIVAVVVVAVAQNRDWTSK